VPRGGRAAAAKSGLVVYVRLTTEGFKRRKIDVRARV